MKQKELAQQAKVSESTVVKWLRGTIPGAATMNRLCKVLRVTPDSLLEYRPVVDPIKVAKEAADGMQERGLSYRDAQIAFEENVSKMQEAVGEDATDWKHRALTAEGKLRRLSRTLKRLTTITDPDS